MKLVLQAKAYCFQLQLYQLELIELNQVRLTFEVLILEVTNQLED